MASAPPRPSSRISTIALPFSRRTRDVDLSGVGVMGDVRECFGDDEVRGRLDMRREPLAVGADADRDRRAAGERLDRGAESLVDEHGWMDAPCQVAQLPQGLAQLLLGFGDELGGLAVGDAGADELECETDAEQPLLSAVVEVAFEPATFVVSGADDARAGGAQLFELGTQLGVQAFVLEREPRGRPGCFEQRLLVGQVRVVHDRGELIADQGHRSAGRLGDLDLAPLLVDPGAAVGEPECELERRVADRSCERVADAAGLDVPELDDEVADGAASAPREEDADRESNRDATPDGAIEPEQCLLPACEPEEVGGRAGDELRAPEDGGESERPERPSHPRRGAPDAPHDEQHEDRAEDDEERREALPDRSEPVDLTDEQERRDMRRAVGAAARVRPDEQRQRPQQARRRRSRPLRPCRRGRRCGRSGRRAPCARTRPREQDQRQPDRRDRAASRERGRSCPRGTRRSPRR